MELTPIILLSDRKSIFQEAGDTENNRNDMEGTKGMKEDDDEGESTGKKDGKDQPGRGRRNKRAMRVSNDLEGRKGGCKSWGYGLG